MADARQSSTALEGTRPATRDPFARIASEDLFVLALAFLWAAFHEGKPRRSKLDRVLSMYRVDPEEVEAPSIPEEVEPFEVEAPEAPATEEAEPEEPAPVLDVVPVLFGELICRALLEGDHGETLAAALAILRALHTHSGLDRGPLALRSVRPVVARPHITVAPTRGSPLRGSAASDGPDLEE